MSAFYLGIPVAHVEAGLRTDDIYAPFPEEMNRRFVGTIAAYHFAPTSIADIIYDHLAPLHSIFHGQYGGGCIAHRARAKLIEGTSLINLI